MPASYASEPRVPHLPFAQIATFSAYPQAVLTGASFLRGSQTFERLRVPQPTRLFTPSAIGVYTLVISATSLFGAVLSLRYDLAIVYDDARHSCEVAKRLSDYESRSPKMHKTSKNDGILTSGSLIAQLLTVAVAPIMTRLFTPSLPIPQNAEQVCELSAVGKRNRRHTRRERANRCMHAGPGKNIHVRYISRPASSKWKTQGGHQCVWFALGRCRTR